MFYNKCLFIFYLFRHRISELPRPIAVKLSHMIDIWVCFVMKVQKIWGLSSKKFGAKNMRNLGLFFATFNFDREYLRNETRYPKSERRDRERFLPHSAKEVWWTLFHYPESRTCEFVATQINFFWETIFLPPGCWPLKFLHALGIHQGLLTHTTNSVGVSQKILRANI